MRFPVIVTLIVVVALVIWAGLTAQPAKEAPSLRLIYLQQQALEFANKYRHQDAIIISKKDHLLYYLKSGQLVRNEVWQGRTYNFPVKVALAGPGYKTPEGEMQIDGKNARSRYILFLSFSGPGDYGIHSAPTRFRAWLDRMEQKYPNFIFATKKDDTRGCVQVENRVIKYLFANVDLNTPVLVMP